MLEVRVPGSSPTVPCSSSSIATNGLHFVVQHATMDTLCCPVETFYIPWMGRKSSLREVKYKTVRAAKFAKD